MTLFLTHTKGLFIALAFVICLFLTGKTASRPWEIADKTEAYALLSEHAKIIERLAEPPVPDSIVKLVNGTKYAVVIWDSKVDKGNAYFSAMLSVSIPSSDEKLIFAAERIPFSNSSGINGKARLKLVQDISIGKGNVINLTFKANETYADIDCNGFQLMSLAGEIELSRDYVLKEKPDGTISDERVKAGFSIATKDFSDFMLKVSLPTFQVKGLKDFSFTVKDAYLDFSDYVNPAGIPLSADYDPTYNTPEGALLWQGLYLQQLKVKLPRFVKKEEGGASSARLEIIADGMLIDDKGISGAFEAGNLLSLEKGTLGGWSISLDKVRIQLLKNQLTQGLFAGTIALPIAGKKDTLGYMCKIGLDNSYLFQARVAQKKLSFPMFCAKEVSLFPNSSLTVQIKDDDAKIRANLSGVITLGASFGAEGSSDKLALDNVKFEELEIANYEPYIAIKGIEYTNAEKNPSVSGFPITINSIGFRASNNILQLKVNMGVNFTAKIAASGGIVVRAKMEKVDGKTKFTFMDVGLDALGVDAEITKITIKGSVVFFKEEPEFGNGFKGNLALTVAIGAAPIKVEAGALFGRIGTHRYWFADAAVSGFRIPVFSGVNITGFAGGVYQGMTKSTTTKNPLSTTISGQRYVPDPQAGIGFQAGVTISIPDPKTISAKVMLELAFNKDASLRRIFFLGEATIMDVQLPGADAAAGILKSVNALNASADATAKGVTNDIPILKQFSGMDNNQVSNTFGGQRSSPPALKAAITLDYNFNNNEFLATFDAYINLYGGVVKGTAGPDGHAGGGSLFISAKNWNLNFGKPSSPISISVLGIATFTSYVMVGTEIEGSPAPPSAVARILGLQPSDLDYMRDLNALGTGKGFAFGARFDVETGDRQFLIFYYRITGGMGFDVMLKDYGKNAYCEGRSGPLGINGWYANGQVYAYFQGSVGINVKLLFIKGRYEILRVGAAAILQAKLPNPTWVKGIIGGEYSILGGLVSGSCRIEAEFGEECKVRRQGDELAGIDVISALTPDNNKTDVSVFVKPQAVFNIPVNEPFEYTDEADPSRNKTFRAKLEEFVLKEKEGANVQGQMEWNKDNTIVAFSSDEILPPTKGIMCNVKIVFEQLKDGVWTPYRNDKGAVEMETKEIQFATGAAPDNIPFENIQYAYPVVGQKNLFKDYSSVGYLQLKRGQAYLFANAAYTSNAKFEIQGAKAQLIPATYTVAQKRVDFKLPEMASNTIFDFSLVNTPKDNNASLDKNVTTTKKEVLASGSEGGSTTVNTKQAEGEILNVEDKILVAYNFRTSYYNDLTNKLREIAGYRGYYSMSSWQTNTVSAEYTLTKEPFDATEILGSDELPPTIVFDVDIKNAPWYTTYMQPLVYKDYPLFGKFSLRRDTSLYGWVPTRNVSLTQSPQLDNLKDAEVAAGKLKAGQATVKMTGNFHVMMFEDFTELRNQVANASRKEFNEAYGRMLMSSFPGIATNRNDTYPVNIYYRMPGASKLIKVTTQNITLR